MSTDVATAWIALIPTVLWILAAAILVWYFHEPIVKYVFPKIRGVQLFGVQIDIATRDLGKALEAHPELPPGTRPEVLLGPVQHRVELVGEILPGSRILWVDDRPQNNLYEVRALVALGIGVDQVTTTEAALTMLRNEQYDLVISDVGRYVISWPDAKLGPDDKPGPKVKMEPFEGFEFLKQAWKEKRQRPTIFYTVPRQDIAQGYYDLKQAGVDAAFGMTTRPDDLFNQVLDVLERYRSVRYFEEKQRKSAAQQH